MNQSNFFNNKNVKRSYKGFIIQMNDFVRQAEAKGKPVVISDTIFGFPSEGDDPNGMHEFTIGANSIKSSTEQNPKCIYCGKTVEELDG